MLDSQTTMYVFDACAVTTQKYSDEYYSISIFYVRPEVIFFPGKLKGCRIPMVTLGSGIFSPPVGVKIEFCRGK